MTTAIDSATPNSHPSSSIMATTETIIRAMQMMENMEIKMFMVERLRIRKAKIIDMMIPVLAVTTNSYSDLINEKSLAPVITPLFSPELDPLLILSISSSQVS